MLDDTDVEPWVGNVDLRSLLDREIQSLALVPVHTSEGQAKARVDN